MKNFDDKYDSVTDGPNDGGIDFIYFDEEDSKLFLCQSKYVSNLSYSEIKREFDNICDTISNFRKGKTGAYNENVRKILQNALDSLPDDERDNIEIVLFTTADNIKDSEEIIKKLNDDIPDLSKFLLSVYCEDDIEKRIQEVHAGIATVSSAKIEIDKAGNYLMYENEHARGIMVNINQLLWWHFTINSGLPACLI